MSHRNLIRWGGLAAVLAGILRGIASFTPTAASVGLQVFYFAIDVLLLLGTIGVYEFQKKETGRWGFFGFLLALIGAVLLIGHDVVNAVVLLYPVAAFLFALGISVLAIRSWEANTLPHWTSALLITSTVVGILGFFVKGLDVLFIISGVIFGIGFSGTGLTVRLQPARSLPYEGLQSASDKRETEASRKLPEAGKGGSRHESNSHL
jgi:hypothetical protein